MSRFIDVHAHFGLDTLLAEVEPSSAKSHLDWTKMATAWSPQAAIRFMDARSIRLQLLSLPANLTTEQTRHANDRGAEIVAQHPTRFGLLARVPMADPSAAVREIGRAQDELSADGFSLLTNYSGRYFGDPMFDLVFAELNRRHATVFVHPVEPAGFHESSCGRPGPVIEFPFDTARTITDALYARLFIRYPHVRFVLAHAGGALPTLAGRIASVGTHAWVPNPHHVTGEEIAHQLSTLYYDTAIAGTPQSLGPVLTVTSADHIIFGTDFTPAGLDVIDANLAALTSNSTLTSDQVTAIEANTLALFPSVAQRLGHATVDQQPQPSR